MTETARVHVIGVGDEADGAAGRASIYYIEDKGGLRAMPIFSSASLAREHIMSCLAENTPQEHMSMMEGLPAEHVGPLTEGRFSVLGVPWPQGLAELVWRCDVDYLVRDLRPGAGQEIMALSDEAKRLLEE